VAASIRSCLLDLGFQPSFAAWYMFHKHLPDRSLHTWTGNGVDLNMIYYRDLDTFTISDMAIFQGVEELELAVIYQSLRPLGQITTPRR